VGIRWRAFPFDTLVIAVCVCCRSDGVCMTDLTYLTFNASCHLSVAPSTFDLDRCLVFVAEQLRVWSGISLCYCCVAVAPEPAAVSCFSSHHVRNVMVTGVFFCGQDDILVEQIKESWSLMDINGDGCVTRDEFQSFLLSENVLNIISKPELSKQIDAFMATGTCPMLCGTSLIVFHRG